MRIGFDAKRAVQNNTGLGNYSRYLIEILSEFYPENQYLLFAPKLKANPRLQTIHSRTNTSFVYPSGLYRFFSSIWRTVGIKRDLEKNFLNIFHGLSGELPICLPKAGIKSVVTVHDLIFLRYPEYYKPMDRKIYTKKFRYACENADRIIAISECTKQDIISYFHIPADKISVIYQGCHTSFKTKATEDQKQTVIHKYSLPSKFILYLGSIESRKNLMLPVKALREIHEEVHLVAIGKHTSYQAEVEQYAKEVGLADRLHILNQVPFSDLPACYQLASVFIYPSFFEGFGIPILEALHSKTPVVAATGSCLEEAGGAGSAYVEPTDAKATAAKINQILSDEALAQQMIEVGLKHAIRFEDREIATNIMNEYRLLYGLK